ncbi:tumor protein p53-inducible protein 11-like isoform X2 [Argiope bruennichi]|uniref:tumor protein p53-inducible protein 11-like isoform X2 n=1 Tax=Argiope bruennichi TaxID=94029 RepID=UPI00249566C1|nr:tumor protein p53-inducible protein 11-like isoform X2 [Argiope bruennichi]XP_055953161.1 tumor protein p53-inducible protein 11-like isoform X2 [Argiope bruennichi]
MPNFASMETLSEPEVYVPYRKHSSGDLQSRLKTRKILGVGETDNGDVHRSKISQVLGHNEHLFVKLPRCYWVWHLGMAMVFTIAGVTHIFAPYTKPDSSPEKETSQPLQMMASLYGSVLLGFAFLLWSFFGTTDKSIARGLMSAIAIAMIAQLFSLLSFAYQNQIWDMQVHSDIFIRLFLLTGSGYFFWAIGSSRAGLRKSLSNKDLREKPTPDDQHSSPVSPIAKQPDKKTD